jgi:pimeloyl-ACP methyl ester carboxylesterase
MSEHGSTCPTKRSPTYGGASPRRRSWVETVYPDVAYFNEVDKGGHFAAWEEPEVFSAEVQVAFRSLR